MAACRSIEKSGPAFGVDVVWISSAVEEIMESIDICLGALTTLFEERLAKLDDVDGSRPRRYGGAPAWCAVARKAAVQRFILSAMELVF